MGCCGRFFPVFSFFFLGAACAFDKCGRLIKCICRTKQYYQYIQKEWMDGDPGQPPPPPERKWVRNKVCVVSREIVILFMR